MNPVLRYEPLVGRLDGLFNEFFHPAFVGDANKQPAPIRVDVSETPEAYSIQAEIPGVKKEDIAVEIEGNEVTIGAEVRREHEATQGESLLHAERFYGKTARRFALPQEIDEAKAAAKFSNGLLELTLPKKASAASRKIVVQ